MKIPTNRILLAVLSAFLCALRSGATSPAFPLYFIDARDQEGLLPDLSQSDIQMLATNFVFGHFGMKGCSPEILKALHAVNPHFTALRYASHQRSDYTRNQVNAEHHRLDLLYYRCGKLSGPVAEQTTEFKLEKLGGPIRLKASTSQADYTDALDPVRKYVHWIRIENELMRVDAWDSTSGTIRVKRGFDGTKPLSFPAGANVLAPIGSAPHFAAESGFFPRYSYDPARLRRWEVSLETALTNAKDGFDGTWYDLVAAEPFRPADILGGPLSDVWDCERHQDYTPEDYRLACENGLNFVMQGYKERTGKWPVIFLNNLIHRQYFPGRGAIQNYLKSTPQKPRPVDGYCIEAFGGSVSGTAFLQAESAGKPPKVQIVAEGIWRSKVRVLMDAAQNGLAAVPYMAMAGRENRGFERINDQIRDHFELWAYASYLIAVERTNGRCSTVLGINPFYWEGNQRKVVLKPRYTWDLGDPVESRSPDRLDEYKRPNHQTYVRKFQRGVVLVNPTNTKDEGVPLGADCIDPETSQRMATATLEPQTGKIFLLHEKP